MVSIKKILAAPFVASFVLSQSAAASKCSSCEDVGSTAFHEQFVQKWLRFWNGDASLLNEIAAPDMVMYQDRVPSATGNGSSIVSVTSSEAFGQAVAFAFTPFKSYHFDLVGWAGTDNIIAVRWTLNGVIGKEAPISSKIGAPVSVNGTDFIFLDECTGLVKTYDLAQDNLNRYHQFGYTSIPV